MKSIYRPNRQVEQTVYRKVKTRRRILRWLVKVVLPLLVVAAAGLSAYFAGAYGLRWAEGRLKSSDLFALEALEVRGAINIAEEEVVETARIVRGDNIMALDLEEIRRRLCAHPLVRTAAVRRRLPSGIIVELSERVPAAVVRADRRYIVDREGYVMRATTADLAVPLPCLTGLAVSEGRVASEDLEDLHDGLRLADVMERMEFPPPSQVECIDVGRWNDAVIVPTEGRPLVHVGREDMAERLRRWKLVAADIDSHLSPVEYIDLRSEGQVVTKPVVPTEDPDGAGGESG